MLDLLVARGSLLMQTGFHALICAPALAYPLLGVLGVSPEGSRRIHRATLGWMGVSGAALALQLGLSFPGAWTASMVPGALVAIGGLGLALQAGGLLRSRPLLSGLGGLLLVGSGTAASAWMGSQDLLASAVIGFQGLLALLLASLLWTLGGIVWRSPTRPAPRLPAGLRLFGVLALLQIPLLLAAGLQTTRHEPMKMAAITASWQAQEATPFPLLAWPEDFGGENRYGLPIPGLGALLATGNPGGTAPHIENYPIEDRPPIAASHLSFTTLTLTSLLTTLLGLIGLVPNLGTKLATGNGPRILFQIARPIGWVGALAWLVLSELGRHPWWERHSIRHGELLADWGGQAMVAPVVAIIHLVVMGLAWRAATRVNA